MGPSCEATAPPFGSAAVVRDVRGARQREARRGRLGGTPAPADMGTAQVTMLWIGFLLISHLLVLGSHLQLTNTFQLASSILGVSARK